MSILGYIAYGLLVLLALSWAWGIRANLNHTLGTGLSSLLLILFAVVVPVSGINRLYAFGMIPAGMFFGVFMMMVGLRWSVSVPGFLYVFRAIRFLGLAYMSILRIGIPKDRLLQAQSENQRRMEARLEALHQPDK